MTRDVPNTTCTFRDILPTTRNHGEGNAHCSPNGLGHDSQRGLVAYTLMASSAVAAIQLSCDGLRTWLSKSFLHYNRKRGHLVTWTKGHGLTKPESRMTCAGDSHRLFDSGPGARWLIRSYLRGCKVFCQQQMFERLHTCIALWCRNYRLTFQQYLISICVPHRLSVRNAILRALWDLGVPAPRIGKETKFPPG